MTKSTAVVPLRSFKLSWVMKPERIPRDVLPPEGEGGEVEWMLQLEPEAPPIRASFNARNYRRMLRELDEHPGQTMVALQGYLTGSESGLLLDRAGFRVERKMARGPGAPPAAREPHRPPEAGRGPVVVQAVRRLK